MKSKFSEEIKDWMRSKGFSEDEIRNRSLSIRLLRAAIKGPACGLDWGDCSFRSPNDNRQYYFKGEKVDRDLWLINYFSQDFTPVAFHDVPYCNIINI